MIPFLLIGNLLPPIMALFVAGLSVAPSVITTVLVERPVRASPAGQAGSAAGRVP